MPGDELRAAQDTLARLEAVGAIGHWQANFASGAIDASAQARRILGIPVARPPTLDGILAAVHPDYRRRFSNAWQRLRSGLPGTAEYRLDGDGERWCEWRAAPETDAAGAIVGACGTVQDISERKVLQLEMETYRQKVWDMLAARTESEAERNALLEKQRNTLVREVHHRIKNHLQGVIGLLADRARETPQLTPALERTIADIQLIAEAYGLQSSRDDAQVTVGQLVELAVKVTAARHPVQCRIADAAHGRALDQPAVVPLALTINELLANAIKHSNPGARACSIDARIDAATDMAVIAIRNGPAWLPPGFDFAAGRGLGTGLELVRILLQRKGTRLGLRTESGTVVAELELAPPA